MRKTLAWVIVASSLAVAVATTIPVVQQLGFVNKRYHYSYVEIAPGHSIEVQPWHVELFAFVLAFAMTLVLIGGTAALVAKFADMVKARRSVPIERP